jgi:hypothetical protein
MESQYSNVDVAKRLADAAGALADELRHIPRPSDSTVILEQLQTAQQHLAGAYRRLAAWHREVEVGVHHAGGPGYMENPGWLPAEVALEEAAQYASDSARALDRAREANENAEWFDEIRADV